MATALVQFASMKMYIETHSCQQVCSLQ